jgi:phage terminase small subunit
MPDKPKRRRVEFDEDDPIGSPSSNLGPSPDTAHPNGGDECSVQEAKFARAYLACNRRIEQAMVVAGYSAKSAHRVGHQLLRTARIKKLIDLLQYESYKRQQLDIDEVVRVDYTIGTTPITSAMDIVIPCCRHCWGTNNEYQRTHQEMEKDYNAHIEALAAGGRKKPPAFNELGGSGYDPMMEPNPSCPNCFGRGEESRPRVVYQDTREMDLKTKMLIAGVQIKDGIPYLMFHDQGAARNRLLSAHREAMNLREDDRGNRLIDITPTRGMAGAREIRKITRVVVRPARNEDIEVSVETDGE